MKNKEFIKKYRQAKPADIEKEIDSREVQVGDLISEAVRGKLKDVRQVGRVKREIAQLKTILKEIDNER